MNAERFSGLALLATNRSKDIDLINIRRRFINMDKRCMELLYNILSMDVEEQLAYDKFGSNFRLTEFDGCVILKLRDFI